MSYNERHKWSEEIVHHDGNYKLCVRCGAKKKNIFVGQRNGRAALYFLPNGDRTSFCPPCRIEFPNVQESDTTEAK